MLASHNYAPSGDLAPYVRNHFVFRASLPDDFELIDPLLSETAMVRIILKGDWAAQFAGQPWQVEHGAILFGNNGRCFNVRVRGPFIVAGTAIRPSGWAALCDKKASDYADKMLPARVPWGDDADALHEQLDRTSDDDAAIVAGLESFWRQQLTKLGWHPVDSEMARFEAIANDDSTVRVADVADELGISARAFERRSCASFGLTPKAVLRRSRFLDLATAIRGISDPGEEQRSALRFSDQSHINREFRYFLNMTPGAFEKASTPLLNAVLKLRYDRNA